MPERCRVCTNPAVDEIHAALDDGQPLARIARHYGLARTSLARHWENHAPARLPATEVAEGETLLERLHRLTDEAERIRRTAESTGDLRLALQAVRELAGLVEMTAKLRGQLPAESVVNVVNLAEWPQVLAALRPYPDAQLAVSRALRGGP